jgi:hypothetical protein
LESEVKKKKKRKEEEGEQAFPLGDTGSMMEEGQNVKTKKRKKKVKMMITNNSTYAPVLREKEM